MSSPARGAACSASQHRVFDDGYQADVEAGEDAAPLFVRLGVGDPDRDVSHRENPAVHALQERRKLHFKEHRVHVQPRICSEVT